jgi:hypothetical protein
MRGHRPQGVLVSGLVSRLPLLGMAVAVVFGMASAACAAPHTPRRPAPILHLVYFHMVDPAETEALLAACEELLAPIPSVTAYAAGRHLDTGRDTVDGDYDLALLVGFDDVEGYQAYLVHPQHLELLSRWKDRLASYTIHDVLDQPLHWKPGLPTAVGIPEGGSGQ